MNKSESKYYNTACLMDEALIILLEKKEFEYITVKEICEKAGVNRSTFYLHYESISELLEEAMEYIINKFLGYFPHQTDTLNDKIRSENLNDLYFITSEYLRPYLQFIKDHNKLFMVYYKNSKLFNANDNYNKMFKSIFNPILDRFNIPVNERKYTMAFYVNGITAIIKEWSINDCKDDIDLLIKVIKNCIKEIK